jgi:hypothetical protein
MRRAYWLISILLSILASGCNFFAPPAADQTQNADHAATVTQIANARQTATMLADHLAITLEYAQTAIRAVDAQSTRIAATLQATGMLVDIRNITPLLSTPTPDGSGGNNSAPPVFAITPVTSGEGAQGNSTLQNQPSLTPVFTQTIDLSAPRLSDIVLTSAIGADDCPTSTTSVFPTNSEGVYVSAVAHNLTQSNVVTSRWSREGSEVVSYPWSPGFEIEEGCIWFYMPASDVDFSAGNWNVQLELDGVPSGQPVMFTVSGMADSVEAAPPQTTVEAPTPLPSG